MVRDLQRQAAHQSALEDERLAAAKEEAAKHEGEATNEAASAQIVALNMKLGFPQTDEQWEVFYDHFTQKPKLAVR